MLRHMELTPNIFALSEKQLDVEIVLNQKGEIILAFSDIFNGFGIRQEIIEENFSAFYEESLRLFCNLTFPCTIKEKFDS